MNSNNQCVLVLDDDLSILVSLRKFLSQHGYHMLGYSHSSELFAAGPPTTPSCLLLDHELEGDITGVEVLAHLNDRGWVLPTIYLTAHREIELVREAVGSGAEAFLTKPFRPEELLASIERAFSGLRSQEQQSEQMGELHRRAAKLTPRERQIVGLVAGGLLNKEIADRLDLALITVKVHRGRAMKKLGAGNAAELGQIAVETGLAAPH